MDDESSRSGKYAPSSSSFQAAAITDSRRRGKLECVKHSSQPKQERTCLQLNGKAAVMSGLSRFVDSIPPRSTADSRFAQIVAAAQRPPEVGLVAPVCHDCREEAKITLFVSVRYAAG